MVHDDAGKTEYEGIRQKSVPTIERRGYVGLSLSVLLAQHNQVMAVDIVQAKVDMINNHKSPIQDDYMRYKYKKRRRVLSRMRRLFCVAEYDFWAS